MALMLGTFFAHFMARWYVPISSKFVSLFVVGLQRLLANGGDGLAQQLPVVHLGELVDLVLRQELAEVPRLDVQALDEVVHLGLLGRAAVEPPRGLAALAVPPDGPGDDVVLSTGVVQLHLDLREGNKFSSQSIYVMSCTQIKFSIMCVNAFLTPKK